jgi:hypothetical protein
MSNGNPPPPGRTDVAAFQDDLYQVSDPAFQPDAFGPLGAFQTESVVAPRAFQTPDAFQAISVDQERERMTRGWPLRYTGRTDALWLEDEWTAKQGPPRHRTGY